MKSFLTSITLAAALLIPSLNAWSADAPAEQAVPAGTVPRVKIQTSAGDMLVELYPERAPKSVANFLTYVREANYDGTLFHRVVSGFMIQGGAYAADYKPRFTHDAVPSESDNGLKNDRGTLAMARNTDPNSATNEFFINAADNSILNYHAPTAGHWGYAVFGRVISGADVLDRICNSPTGAVGPFTKEAPLTAVVITKVSMETPAAPVNATSAALPEAKPVKEEPKKATRASKKHGKKAKGKSHTAKSAGKSGSVAGHYKSKSYGSAPAN